MWNRVLPAVSLMVWVLSSLAAGPAMAEDEEGCLFCHRLGLVVRNGQETRHIQVEDPAGSAHASLYCSDCHPDAKIAPHPERPSPASCIGDCHGVTTSAKDSHRRASVGRGVEAHRKISFPRAPCHLCHRGEDKAGDRAAIDSRCRGCHREKVADVLGGIHSRVSTIPEANRCSGCHPPHAGGTNAGTSSCEGTGCHAKVSTRMKSLAGHETGAHSWMSFQRAGSVGAFLVIAILGWFGGRWVSMPRGKGENP